MLKLIAAGRWGSIRRAQRRVGVLCHPDRFDRYRFPPAAHIVLNPA
jgi:hypothetical protein